MSENHLFPAPPENPESDSFYDAAAQGRFLGKRCKTCGRHHWYPREFCPFCHGETEWVQLSGEGVVYSFSYMRRAANPYVIAYVSLKEGPTMMTNIVDCDPESISIGSWVRLQFKPSQSGRMIPCFTPAQDS